MASAATKALAEPKRSLAFEGKKFLWDGRRFETEDQASREAKAYEDNRFEVRTLGSAGDYLLYTRRVVKEAVTTAP